MERYCNLSTIISHNYYSTFFNSNSIAILFLRFFIFVEFFLIKNNNIVLHFVKYFTYVPYVRREEYILLPTKCIR